MAVKELQQSHEVSERRACQVLDQPRSSQRYEPQVAEDEGPLVRRMLELARQFPRYGYRFITAKLRQDGWSVNAKRVYRLWRREGLKVPKKKRKKRRLGSSQNGCVRRRAEGPNDVWCWDFVFDRTTTGSPLKWLSIVDEFTRECLCLKVDRSITSDDVLDTLAELFATRGVPSHIRSDNGPEFIAQAIQDWLAQLDIEALYIEPGSPWENGYAESFHSRLRDEFLALEEFESLKAARRLTASWRAEYNNHRPHSSLNYQTPSAFAEGLTSTRARQTGAAPSTIPLARPLQMQAEATAKADGAQRNLSENLTSIP
jgi:transposase InsO family protein